MDIIYKLKKIKDRFDEIDVLLSSGEVKSDEFNKYSIERAELEPVAQAYDRLFYIQSQIADLKLMVSDKSCDLEMHQLAQQELHDSEKNYESLVQDIKIMLLPKDEADSKNAIMEIRAGTGGDEAALFASDLFEMYQKYAQGQGWRFEVLDAAPTPIGGYKEIRAEISGRNVFAKLKFESGVHRVQRIPKTETGGRIHTSAATVAVLPEAEEVDLELPEKDLRIDTFRSSGAGGQHVNTTDSAVRITHIPTGIFVSQQDEKSQHKNKAKALKILRARLYQIKLDQVMQERAQTRKSQIGSGDRSERIRTYNFPQGRVTDHRINLTLHKLDLVLAGEALEEIIHELITTDQAQKLAELE